MSAHLIQLMFAPVTREAQHAIEGTGRARRSIVALLDHLDGDEYELDSETRVARMAWYGADQDPERTLELARALESARFGYEMLQFTGGYTGRLYSWRPGMRARLVRAADYTNDLVIPRPLYQDIAQMTRSYELLNDYFTTEIVPLGVLSNRQLSAAERQRYERLIGATRRHLHR